MVGEESIILCFSQYTIPQNFQSITYKNVINQRTFIVRNLSEIMETPCRTINNCRCLACICQVFRIGRVSHVFDDIRFRTSIKVARYYYGLVTTQLIYFIQHKAYTFTTCHPPHMIQMGIQGKIFFIGNLILQFDP